MSQEHLKDIETVDRIDSVHHILEVICMSTGLGFSAVARVTETNWVACAVRDEIEFGLKPGDELPVETTICDEIRSHGKIIVIDHVAEDEQFRNHPTPRMYGFQSYISVPIYLADGQFFGTLCAIGPSPARLNTPATIGMFKLFAELIATHIQIQDQLIASEAALLSEREVSHLREQFIAVLGHDLRNPLGAIGAGTEILRFQSQTEDVTDILDMIQRGTIRMAGIIDNILDFARGRLGNGLSIMRVTDARLEVTLQQVVKELQAAWPRRAIHRVFDLTHEVYCDSGYVAQMFSNLLGNALIHGDEDSPIWTEVRSTPTQFSLVVKNLGATIPPHILSHLFEPFARGIARPGEQGLGLGLYIAAEIARAHEGSLRVLSEAGETIFKFEMPLGNPS